MREISTLALQFKMLSLFLVCIFEWKTFCVGRGSVYFEYGLLPSSCKCLIVVSASFTNPSLADCLFAWRMRFPILP